MTDRIPDPAGDGMREEIAFIIANRMAVAHHMMWSRDEWARAVAKVQPDHIGVTHPLAAADRILELFADERARAEEEIKRQEHIRNQWRNQAWEAAEAADKAAKEATALRARAEENASACCDAYEGQLAMLQQVAKDLGARAEGAERERDEARAELYEVYEDEQGNNWTRPTAWAFAAACKARTKHQNRADKAEAQLATLTAEKEAVEARVGELERRLKGISAAVSLCTNDQGLTDLGTLKRAWFFAKTGRDEPVGALNWRELHERADEAGLSGGGEKDLGAASGTGSHASHSAPSGLHPEGFDPSRDGGSP